MDGMEIPPPPDSARDGFGASRARRLDLAIEGLSGSSCAARVERALLRTDGVLSASVDLATARARVLIGGDHGDDKSLAERLRAAVQAVGYSADLVEPAPASGDVSDQASTLHLALSCALTTPLVVSSLLQLLFGLSHLEGLARHCGLPGWLQFLLATPVQFWLGWRVYRDAAAALRRGVGSKEQLAALGSSAAWGVSTVAFLAGAQAFYFEIAALIVTSVLLGEWLERRVLLRAAASLPQPAPRTATRRDPTTLRDQDVPFASVCAGDLLVATAGSLIAVDGVIREGEARLLNPAGASGDPPIATARGEPVQAGALVTEGSLVVEVLAAGAQTRLAAIARLIASAPAGTRRLADRVSTVVGLASVMLALLTFAVAWAAGAPVTSAALRAVLVLVIACPCALGMATPAAFAVGVRQATRSGILIRDPGAIERAGEIGIVALDRGGVLSGGTATLDRVVPALGTGHYAEAAELLSLAAAMQAGHAHPLAAAVRAASGHAVTQTAERVQVLPGLGVTARVGGRSLLLGSRRIIEGEAIAVTAPLIAEAERAEAEGAVVCYLAERRARGEGGSRVLGLLGFAEMSRDGAAEAMARLSRRGVTTVLLTGAAEAASRRIAAAAGVDRLLCGLSAGQKSECVAALARERRGTDMPAVAMVGSGGNDAPALAASDLGIAVGQDEAAAGAAGIVLLRHQPALAVDAIEIACVTAGRMRAGLFWAFLFNLAGIPLAAAGLLSPSLACAAMALGGIGVAVSGLWQRPRSQEARPQAQDTVPNAGAAIAAPPRGPNTA